MVLYSIKPYYVRYTVRYQNYIIDHDKILAQLDEKKKLPKPKANSRTQSKWWKARKNSRT